MNTHASPSKVQPDPAFRGKAVRRKPNAIAEARRQRRRKRLLWALLLLSMLASVLVLGDRWVARYQAHVIEQRIEARNNLDRMVLHYLRADVLDVVHTDDGRYKVTIQVENVYPEFDMYILVPQVSTFAQVGPMWEEVPTSDPGTSNLRAGTVVKLTERITFERVFELPKDKQYFELLKGFYHVRFDNLFFVSPHAEPKDDIAERLDNYFIHLLPVGANKEAILRDNQFPGNKVPYYIPMPPH